MNCNNKIKHTCGTKVISSCVEYQGTVSATSILFGNSCLDIQEIAEDLYSITDSIKINTDVTTVVSACQTLPLVKTTKTIIQFLLDRDCTQQSQITLMQADIVIMKAQILALQTNVCP